MMRFILPLLVLLGCGDESASVARPEVASAPAASAASGDDSEGVEVEPGPAPGADPLGEEAPAEEAPPEPIEAAAPAEPEFPAPEGERPEQAVERCQQTEAYERCLVAALDDEDVRARERQLLIDAHLALGNEDRAHEHMRIFVEQYPRDRRGNAYRIALDRADQ